jgi:hypothetical protein
MSRILASSVWPNVAIVPLDGIVGVEVLEIIRLRISELFGCFDKCVFSAGARVGALRDMD